MLNLAHSCNTHRYIFFSSTRDQALGAKRLCCLLAPSAFTFGADRLGAMEGGNSGLTWDNYWSGPLSVGETMAFMILDTLIYTVLAWYLDKVLPDANGTPLPWSFPCLPAYWLGKAIHHTTSADDDGTGNGAGRRWGGRLCGVLPLPHSRSQQGPAAAGGGGGAAAGAADLGAQADTQADTQEADPGARVAVEIKGLRKAFPGRGLGGGTVAVRGLNLSIYTDQITALLGHNGAGKVRIAEAQRSTTQSDVARRGAEQRRRGVQNQFKV